MDERRARDDAGGDACGTSVGQVRVSWSQQAHPGQLPPPGDWRVWLIRAGRGFGKTRAGAEWVSQFARDHPAARIALVGGTAADVAKVMIEGASGLVGVAHPGERVGWSRMKGEVRFASGAVAHVYSAHAPEGLRGPEHHLAWCDELAKWQGRGRGDGSATWDNLLLGLRLGERPRVLVTTTPRPNALMRRVMAGRGMVETRGATRDNPHLPACFVAEVEDQYGGTRLGRQELDGEMIDDVAGALWNRATIEACRSDKAFEPRRVVIGVDPPAGGQSGGGAAAQGDACGIIAAAIDGDGIVHVLEDASVAGETPDGWARAVAACADRHRADRVVAEKNQGGAMVRSVLEIADASMPIALVSATTGMRELRDLLAAWRDAKRSAWKAAFGWLSAAVLAALAVTGSAQDALKVALATFRRAKIDAVHVGRNTRQELSFGRMYHDHRGKAEGKKVGRAVIVVLVEAATALPQVTPEPDRAEPAAGPSVEVRVEVFCDCGHVTPVPESELAEPHVCSACGRTNRHTLAEVMRVKAELARLRQETRDRLDTGMTPEQVVADLERDDPAGR